MDNIETVAREIEDEFQEMCHSAMSGGAATIDQLADALSLMSRLASIVAEISKKVSP
jgi:hypothetical protein